MDGVLQAGAFLRDHLRKIEPEIIRTVYPELWGADGKYHTAVSGLPFGLREIYQSRIDWTGTAVNFGGKATNIPLANLGVIWDKYRTLVGIIAAEWQWTDLEAQRVASLSGIPAPDVIREYRAALSKGLREWLHIRSVFGDPSIGFQGLFTGADVTLIDVATNLNTETPRNLNDFFRGVLRSFRKASRLTVNSPSMLVSVDLDFSLSAPFQDAGAFQDARSPKEYLLKNGISSINVVNECSNDYLAAQGITSVSTTKDFFMLYESTSDTLDKMYSDEYVSPVRLKDDMATYRITGFTACSEMRFKYPYRVRYYTYPKA